MSRIFGYGEDAFTFWTLKNKKNEILKEFDDRTSPSDCIVFYRPSFGRSGGEKSAEFGEFDGILVSTKNIYLIESKWDNLTKFKNSELILGNEQIFRHQVFSWYLTHWDKKYSNNWENFEKEQSSNFQQFNRKKIAPTDSLLATNLEFILTKALDRCKKFSSDNIKNLLLFFCNSEKSNPPSRISRTFKLIPIDYSKEINCNFVPLD